MIPEDLKVDVLELATISKQCPENLQQRCFELLLSHYLDRLTTGSTPKDAGTKTGTDANGGNHDPAAESANGASTEKKAAHESGSDLSLPDLHVKAKRFLEKTGTTIEELNQVFYKEGEEIRPLYEDLKTTKVAESQIRIALLQALASGIKTGEFQFDGEEVRKECQTRKCYDGNNFSNNFRNNAALFDGFDGYNKQQSIIRLSEDGRKTVAQIIKELQ